eukprot:6212516-Pleurochrysis_carterae.AAC.1
MSSLLRRLLPRTRSHADRGLYYMQYAGRVSLAGGLRVLSTFHPLSVVRTVRLPALEVYVARAPAGVWCGLLESARVSRKQRTPTERLLPSGRDCGRLSAGSYE